MTILVDARPIVDAARGGVSRVALEMCVAYAEAFPTDTLICVTTGSKKPLLPDRLLQCPNVQHVHLSWPNKLWSVAAMLGIVSLVTEAKKRVPTINAAFFPNLGFIGKIPKNIPSVLLLHDLSFLIEPRWFTFKQRIWHRAIRASQLITSTTQLLSVSETTKCDAMRLLNIPSNHITVIPLGPTVPPATSYQLPATSSPYILCLGANDARKNTKTAIEAVRALRAEEKYSDIELVIVGARFIAPNENKMDWIRSVERPTDDQLSTLYKNAAAFVYPSWYEGFGLPLHEAAQFDTPCIASTSGALPETAPPGTFFANPMKPHQWATAIKLALELPHTPTTSSPPNWNIASTKLKSALDRMIESAKVEGSG
jgi:glycosyltransferase involved in cell wall biosynthesis